MKYNYFNLFKYDYNLKCKLSSRCRFSFSDTIDSFLEELYLKYPREEYINLSKYHLDSCKSEEELKNNCIMNFDKVRILEYFDKDGNKLKGFDLSCSSIKVSRPPIIHDILARFLDYQKETPYFKSDYNNFEDVKNSNLIRELKAWYNCSKISVIRFYSLLDMLANFESRCINDIDKHISKIEKARIIRELFSYLILNVQISVQKDKLNEMIEPLNIIAEFELNHSNKMISEIKNLIDESDKNANFLNSIGFNVDYIDNRDENVIVVSHIHGLIANKNLFTGRITVVSKYYNSDNDSKKDRIYFEEHEINVDTQYFKVATKDDIYTYRENYYLLDGTRPFFNMKLGEIK